MLPPIVSFDDVERALGRVRVGGDKINGFCARYSWHAETIARMVPGRASAFALEVPHAGRQ